jgi:hypothetical protein
MTSWRAMAVLPNIEVGTPVEGGLGALVGYEDKRLKAIRRAHPNLDRFLGRFTDAFGVKLRPAVMIQRLDAPDWTRNVDAIASFRDAVVLATVPYNRALEVNHLRGHRITFSNSFWLYPWMLDRNNEDLIANTPGMLALHQVETFKGQSAPEMPGMTLTDADLDLPLLDALLARWHQRYNTRKPDWSDRALFRSLNMAHQAAQLPAGMDTTFYDVGRMIALWVSAFEILTHPGEGMSGLHRVYELLDKVEWKYRKSALKRYKAYPKKPKSPRRTAACWLYGEIHCARNDFLHGNEVTPAHLRIRNGEHNLFELAAPLYRLALTAFLPLSSSGPLPSVSDTEAFAAEIVRQSSFDHYQGTAEKAILLARGIDPDRGIRERRARRRRNGAGE